MVTKSIKAKYKKMPILQFTNLSIFPNFDGVPFAVVNFINARRFQSKQRIQRRSIQIEFVYWNSVFNA